MVYGLYPKGIEEAKDITQASSRKNAVAYFAQRNDMSKKNLLILYEVKKVRCPGFKT
tara:strand:+ start:865 stop:1035 length:171 start_codon:yes stop_codon:yes gene_type:complete